MRDSNVRPVLSGTTGSLRVLDTDEPGADEDHRSESVERELSRESCPLCQAPVLQGVSCGQFPDSSRFFPFPAGGRPQSAAGSGCQGSFNAGKGVDRAFLEPRSDSWGDGRLSGRTCLDGPWSGDRGRLLEDVEDNDDRVIAGEGGSGKRSSAFQGSNGKPVFRGYASRPGGGDSHTMMRAPPLLLSHHRTTSRASVSDACSV